MPNAKKEQKTIVYELDANQKPLGRFASEVAVTIRGKKTPQYHPRVNQKIGIHIKNIEKIGITEKKLRNNVHYHFTGYPGGLKSIKWQEAFDKDPKTFFLNTVRNMLPNNSFRKQYLKMITFK